MTKRCRLITVLAMVMFGAWPVRAGGFDSEPSQLARAAETWAERMFDAVGHDFQMLARGAEARHVFTITNPHQDTVHISKVSKSCACTSARLDKTALASGEQARLEVRLDTLRRAGSQRAVVEVIFDRPGPATVQLELVAEIRQDLVVAPGSVCFGAVGQGQTAQREVSIAYTGRDDWRIEELENTNPFVDASLAETRRRDRRVDYELTLRLKPDAPQGYLRDQLRLISNEPGASDLLLPVQAKIEPPVTLHPSTLMLGVLRPGDSVTRTVVLRAKTPFRVSAIDIQGDSAFAAPLPAQPGQVQVITVTYTAGPAEGQSQARFRVRTDLDGTELTFAAHAQVRRDTPSGTNRLKPLPLTTY